MVNKILYNDIPNFWSIKYESCTVAAELVIRGYDVEAGYYSTPEAKELGTTGKSAYLDPETGEECVRDVIDTNKITCYDYFEQNIKQGERYEFSYYTQRDLFFGESNENAYNNQKTKGHVVLISRNDKNEIRWYDPQDGERHEGEDARKYLESWVNEKTLFEPRILRVDDKALNMKYINSVVRKR